MSKDPEQEIRLAIKGKSVDKISRCSLSKVLWAVIREKEVFVWAYSGFPIVENLVRVAMKNDGEYRQGSDLDKGDW